MVRDFTEILTKEFVNMIRKALDNMVHFDRRLPDQFQKEPSPFSGFFAFLRIGEVDWWRLTELVRPLGTDSFEGVSIHRCTFKHSGHVAE